MFLFKKINAEFLAKKALLESFCVTSKIEERLCSILAKIANTCDIVMCSGRELPDDITELGKNIVLGLYEVVEDAGVALSKHGGHVPFYTTKFSGLEITIFANRIELRNTLKRQIKNIKAKHYFGRNIDLGKVKITSPGGLLKQERGVIFSGEKVDLLGNVIFARRVELEVEGRTLKINLQKVVPLWHYLVFQLRPI